MDKFFYDPGDGKVKHMPAFDLGGLGREPGKLIYPYGITVDSIQNRIFVTDQMNGRVQVFHRQTGALQEGSVWGRWHDDQLPSSCIGETGVADPCEGEAAPYGYGLNLPAEKKLSLQAVTGIATRCQRPVVIESHIMYFEFSWKGDFDGDADVDLSDFAHLQTCYSGPGIPPGSGCDDADLDRDNDVDQDDFSVFQTRLTGALSCETPIGAQGPESGGPPEPETRSPEEVLAWSAAGLLQSSGIDVWADNQITSGELLPLLEVYAQDRGIALSAP